MSCYQNLKRQKMMIDKYIYFDFYDEKYMEKNQIVSFACMTEETVRIRVAEGKLSVRVWGKTVACVDTIIKLTLADQAVMEE